MTIASLSRRDRAVIIVAAVLMCATPLAATLLGDLRERPLTYAVLAVSGAAVLLLFVEWMRRRGIELTRATIFAVALAARVAAMPMAPSLSSDAWRSLWDGRLVVHGINPYLVAPSDPSLARYHDRLYGLLGNPETPSVHPPAAQILFAAAAWPSLLAPIAFMRVPDWHGASYYLLKLMLLVIELAAIVALLGLLEHLGRPRRSAVLYAWHPLVVIELAGQGHYDAVVVAALGLALLAAARRTVGRGMPWLVAGGLAGLLPLALLPLWARREGARRTLIGLAVSLPLALLLAPLVAPGALGGFLTTSYQALDGGFLSLMKWILDRLAIAPSSAIAGAIGAALELIVLAVATWRLRRGDAIDRLAAASLVVVSATLLLGPTAHPWWFVAPLFLATLDDRSPLSRAWQWIALVAPLTYLAYAGDRIGASAASPWLEWGGAVVVALVVRRALKTQRAAGDGGAFPASTDRSNLPDSSRR